MDVRWESKPVNPLDWTDLVKNLLSFIHKYNKEGMTNRCHQSKDDPSNQHLTVLEFIIPINIFGASLGIQNKNRSSLLLSDAVFTLRVAHTLSFEKVYLPISTLEVNYITSSMNSKKFSWGKSL